MRFGKPPAQVETNDLALHVLGPGGLRQRSVAHMTSTPSARRANVFEEGYLTKTLPNTCSHSSAAQVLAGVGCCS